MALTLMDHAIVHAREIGALVVLLALAAVFLVQNGESELLDQWGYHTKRREIGRGA